MRDETPATQEARRWVGLSGAIWRDLEQYLVWLANNPRIISPRQVLTPTRCIGPSWSDSKPDPAFGVRDLEAPETQITCSQAGEGPPAKCRRRPGCPGQGGAVRAGGQGCRPAAASLLIPPTLRSPSAAAAPAAGLLPQDGCPVLAPRRRAHGWLLVILCVTPVTGLTQLPSHFFPSALQVRFVTSSYLSSVSATRARAP